MPQSGYCDKSLSCQPPRPSQFSSCIVTENQNATSWHRPRFPLAVYQEIVCAVPDRLRAVVIARHGRRAQDHQADHTTDEEVRHN